MGNPPTTTVDPTAFPTFPTTYTDKDAARLASLTSQKAEMEKLYQQKFTPTAWSSLNPFEKAVRSATAALGLGGVAAAIPGNWEGLNYGLTPAQATQKLQDVNTEYLGLVRAQKVTSLLPEIENNMALAALSGKPLTSIGEILPGDLGNDFNDADKAYLVGLGQKLATATPEEIENGSVFNVAPSTSTNTYTDQYATMPQATTEQVMSSVAFSKNIGDIASVLQEAFPPSIVSPNTPPGAGLISTKVNPADTGTGTLAEKTNKDLLQQAADLGIVVPPGSAISEILRMINEKKAELQASGKAPTPLAQGNIPTAANKPNTIRDAVIARAKELGVTVTPGESEEDIIKAANQAIADSAGTLITLTNSTDSSQVIVTQKSDNSLWSLDGKLIGRIDPKTGDVSLPSMEVPVQGVYIAPGIKMMPDFSVYSNDFKFAPIGHYDVKTGQFIKNTWASDVAAVSGWIQNAVEGTYQGIDIWQNQNVKQEQANKVLMLQWAKEHNIQNPEAWYQSIQQSNQPQTFQATTGNEQTGIPQGLPANIYGSPNQLRQAQAGEFIYNYVMPAFAMSFLPSALEGWKALGEANIPLAAEVAGKAVLAVPAAIEAAQGAVLKYGIQIPLQALGDMASTAGTKAFESILDTGLDKWIAEQGRLNPEDRTWFSNFVVNNRDWLTQRATDNYLSRLAANKAARAAGSAAASAAEQAASEAAVDDTLKDLTTKLLESPDMAPVKDGVEPIQSNLEAKGMPAPDAESAALKIYSNTPEGQTAITNTVKTANAKAVAKAALIPKIKPPPVIKSTDPTYKAVVANLPPEVQSAIKDTAKTLVGQGVAPSASEDYAIKALAKTPRGQAQLNIAQAKEEATVPALTPLRLKKIAGLEEKLATTNEKIAIWSTALKKQMDVLNNKDVLNMEEDQGTIVNNLQVELNELVASKNETIANIAKMKKASVSRTTAPVKQPFVDKVKPVKIAKTKAVAAPAYNPETDKLAKSLTANLTKELGINVQTPAGVKTNAEAMVGELGKGRLTTNSLDETTYTFKTGNVELMLTVLKDGTINITNLHVDTPKQGLGSATLKNLTDLADKYGVRMNLVAASSDVPTAKLISWYEKNGFKLTDPDKGVMVREPQEVGKAQESKPGEIQADEATHDKLGRFEIMRDSEGRMIVCE